MVASLVHPVMQKVGSIVARHIKPFNVETIYLRGWHQQYVGYQRSYPRYDWRENCHTVSSHVGHAYWCGNGGSIMSNQ